jgi:hypothetical protein
MRRHSLKNTTRTPHDDMTLDEKIRFGMVALSGASLVFATLGLHAGPLEVIAGYSH